MVSVPARLLVPANNPLQIRFRRVGLRRRRRWIWEVACLWGIGAVAAPFLWGLLFFGSAIAMVCAPDAFVELEVCTGAASPASAVLVAAATAGGSLGAPVQAWWLEVAGPATLLRLCRTEDPELGSRCTGMDPGRRATVASPRRSRRGSYSTLKAFPGDGASSIQVMAEACVFLRRSWQRLMDWCAGWTSRDLVVFFF